MNKVRKRRKGSLIVLGTGISAGQLTRESIGHIKEADIVLFSVADIATKRLLKTLNRNTEDLTSFYVTDKLRPQIYQQITDRILHFVRSKQRVCVAFYGHPGFFATASHAAIEKARTEGFRAKMLPAVSSLDCLLADLGIDPGVDGCQILEATNYLTGHRVLDKHSNVILLQVRSVGDWSSGSRGFDGRNVSLLTARLREVYGADHKVVVYEASTRPNAAPLIKIVKLQNLRPAHVSAGSTLYIPPIEIAPLDLRIFEFFSETANAE